MLRSLLLPLVAVSLSAGQLQVPLGPTPGAFSLVTGPTQWFRSANFSVTVDNTRYSTTDGSLKPRGAAVSSTSSDRLGEFKLISQSWRAGSAPWVTSIKLYSAQRTAIFEQSFPSGASGTSSSPGHSGGVSSCYPSIDPGSPTQPLGFVSWQGRFLEGSKAGKWSTRDAGVGTGDAGGPFVVFGEEMNETLVFSAASNFMQSSQQLLAGHGLCFGLDSAISEVPKGFTLSTMVHLGRGVTSGMKSYGTALLQLHGTVRQPDFTRQWLGYSTDNGAFYYYNTEKGPDGKSLTYEQTLLDVHKYSKELQIPYKYVLLDSYWYTKGDGGGVANWTETAATFPDGIESLEQQTGWKFQMHNRHWSDNNIYAKQNGGQYDFIVEHPLAIPNSSEFWIDLIANKTKSGIVVYEQDWMYNEYQELNATRSSATLSRDWLMQMGAGAARSNVTVQYCMTFARMVLQSAEIPSVTTFRASDDYHPGQTGYFPTQKDPSGKSGCAFPFCVYYIGTTSIIAHALDLGPSKDNYWSTQVQHGNPYSRGATDNTAEPYNEMQSAISSYSTAQVAPSDSVGRSNASLIMMACTGSGRLLQPSAPARAIDESFRMEAFGTADGPKPMTEGNHAVMATHTLVGTHKWSHVLVIGLASTFDLLPVHLSDDVELALPLIGWTGYGKGNITLTGDFSADSAVRFDECGYSDFRLWHAAPVFSNGVALLGESSKWVPVAVARVQTCDEQGSELVCMLHGESGEQADFAFAFETKVYYVECVFPSAGAVTVSFETKDKRAKCM